MTAAQPETVAPFVEALSAELAEHSALPYLFLGSGVSRRYLGLPDWPGLLRRFAAAIGEDFDYHFATANGDLPKTASAIASQFHTHWWNDPEYEAQREEFKSEVRDEEGGLKVAVASFIRNHQSLDKGTPGVDDPALSVEIEKLRKVSVDGVITTNYDSFTDDLFPTFKPYVGQDDLLLSDAQFIAETYKIHGSVGDPASLVLTAADYEVFDRRNHYLTAKLLTIFAEHPVIFVGYSITDEYIGQTLDDIATAVGPDRLDELGHRIYFVEWNSDPATSVSIERTSIVRANARLPITRIETHELGWVWDAISSLDRPFPAAVLRELRKHVFDLVTHPDPEQSREAVRAIPIEDDSAGDLRVVFGVGTFTEKDLDDLSTISARSLTLADIEEDVLGIRKRLLTSENVLKFGIPDNIRPSAKQFVPVHKYLAETGRIDAEGVVSTIGLPGIIDKLAKRDITPSAGDVARFERSFKGKLKTPKEVMASSLPLYFKLACLQLISLDGFELNELRDVLRGIYASHPESEYSGFRRVLCHYDRAVARAVATGA
ncbi:SIR2 family protein [Curtobacterium citreum]|uniref:SIR2 family protein n=1 Tax=Curtobacterium citreum TaxID=2036 RepID=UPI00217EC26D|nr:SIR2 family protein [Curtobacterium flaccumfaciens]MCS6581515.1 SIR2 family protein [Curtobacterium flaccumfaciens pv. beticola]